MTRLRCLIFVLVCFPRWAMAGDHLSLPELQRQLTSTLGNSSATRRATVCLKVLDAATGAVVFDQGGDRLLTPASNLKIYTAACALDKFGPGKRFDTELRAAAEIEHGTLRGDLVLVGGGDAMLTTVDLRQLAARAVNQWGLRRVLGAVRVDNSRYGSPLKGPGWMWDDDPAEFNMSVTPLMLDFNVLTVRLTALKPGLRSTLVPPSDDPPLRRAVSDGDSQDVQVTRAAFRDEIIIIPGKLAAPSQEFRLTMHNPGSWAAGVLRMMLLEQGVAIQPAELSAAQPQSPTTGTAELFSLRHEGVTLQRTISHLLQVSENAVGEVLLHEIAVVDGISRPTWSDGAAAVTSWLTQTAGLEPGSFRLVDGSGLSRYNLISADSSVRLLKYMHGHKHFNDFFRSLKTYPVEVEDDRAVDGDVNRVHAKSGGMTGVATISGYVRTLDGKLLAFSFLANGFIGSNAPLLELRDEVWQALVRYRP